MAVMEQLGNRVFTQAADVNHFNDHVIGMEIDHFSALTRCVVRAYIAVRIKTYMGNTSVTDITIQRFLETLGAHFIYLQVLNLKHLHL